MSMLRSVVVSNSPAAAGVAARRASDLRHRGRRGTLWRAALTAGAVALAPTVARAAGEPPRAADQEEAPGEVGLGLGVGQLFKVPGALGDVFTLATDAWYRPLPWLAAGAELQMVGAMTGDQCQQCMRSYPLVGLGFVEARVAPRAIVSPFVRLGMGGGFFRYTVSFREQHDGLHPMVLAAVGPQLTLAHFFLRVRGTLTATPYDALWGWGFELGALLDTP